MNTWITYRHNFPSAVKTQRLFRIKLIEELVQPLLSLCASPSCPPYLRGSGRPSSMVTAARRLVGKHFVYKAKKRGCCAVCSSKISPSTSKRTDKKVIITARSAMCFFVWECALNSTIHSQVTDCVHSYHHHKTTQIWVIHPSSSLCIIIMTAV